MTPEIPFVLGFAVNPSVTQVLLQLKKRGPSFNIGRWNGDGGKIKPGEGPRGAMAREHEEETGLATNPEDWECFHMEGHRARYEQTLNPRIYCMTIMLTNDEFAQQRTAEDEEVRAFLLEPRVRDPILLPENEGVYNLTYLLEMVRCWHLHPEHRWIEG